MNSAEKNVHRFKFLWRLFNFLLFIHSIHFFISDSSNTNFIYPCHLFKLNFITTLLPFIAQATWIIFYCVQMQNFYHSHFIQRLLLYIKAQYVGLSKISHPNGDFLELCKNCSFLRTSCLLGLYSLVKQINGYRCLPTE